MTRARMPRPSEVQSAAGDPRYLRAMAANTDDPFWRAQAPCRRRDPELWYPLPTEPADVALSICRSCDVQAECLAEALNAKDGEFGVWGATTPRDRRAMLVAWWQRPGTAPAPRKSPEPKTTPAPTGKPEFCSNEHKQTPDVRRVGSNGVPYCRKCQSDAGKLGNAVRNQLTADRAERLADRQVAS